MMTHDKDFDQRKLRLLRQGLFQNRKLFLEHDINSNYMNDPSMIGWASSARAVIDQILYLDYKDNAPIILTITSPGGDTERAFELYDVMMAARSPIYTVAKGAVASAAVLILVAGKAGFRFIFPHSRTMIHLGEGSVHGQRRQMKKQLNMVDKIEIGYITTLARHTGKTSAEIEGYMEEEYYMDAEESKNFGLVDQIVPNLEGTYY